MKLCVTDYKIDLWPHIYIWENRHVIRPYSKLLKISVYDESNHSPSFQLSEQKNYWDLLNEKHWVTFLIFKRKFPH